MGEVRTRTIRAMARGTTTSVQADRPYSRTVSHRSYEGCPRQHQQWLSWCANAFEKRGIPVVLFRLIILASDKIILDCVKLHLTRFVVSKIALQ
jgi:hypothetical protein